MTGNQSGRTTHARACVGRLDTTVLCLVNKVLLCRGGAPADRPWLVPVMTVHVPCRNRNLLTTNKLP